MIIPFNLSLSSLSSFVSLVPLTLLIMQDIPFNLNKLLKISTFLVLFKIIWIPLPVSVLSNVKSRIFDLSALGLSVIIADIVESFE